MNCFTNNKTICSVITRVFFLFLLSLTALNAEYPKTYARLGTPLFKAQKAFENFREIAVLKIEVQEYKLQSDKVLVIGLKADKTEDKKLKKMYLKALRKLQKNHDRVLHFLHTGIQKSIAEDNYKLFLQLTYYAFDGLFQNTSLRNRAIHYYAKNRDKEKCSVLEKDISDEKLLKKTNEFFAAEIVKSSYSSYSKNRTQKSVGIVAKRVKNRINVQFYNKNIYAVTIKVNAKYKNITSSFHTPKEFVIPAHSTVGYTELQLKNSYAEYSLSWVYTMGSKNAKHNDNYIYRLPYKKGTSHRVSQGYNGNKTHKGNSAYSIDFSMSVGTKIYAAREGIVVKTKSNSDIGGYDKKFASSGNFVRIMHNDGTFATYYHLKYNGVSVNKGERVLRGEPIGYSGNTGYTSGPHLHFSVFKAKSSRTRMTLPTKMLSREGVMSVPVVGHYYRAK